MSGPDYPQDDQPGTPSKVPSLIHDYRAQRDAWREQARNLARMREEVLAAADHEAKDIVSAARADIRRILLKARRDLLVLAAQVRAAGRLGEPDDPPEAVNLLPTNDLDQAQDVLTSARHDVRRVLDESRPELEGLAAEGEALRAALRQQKPIGPVPVEKRRQIATPVVHDALDTIDAEPARPVDFEFSSLGADDSPDLVVNGSRLRPMRALLTVAASVGALAVMGTALWLYRPSSAPKTSQAPVESKASSSSTSKPVPSTTKSTASANAAVKSAATSTSPASIIRTPIPEPRAAGGSGQRAPLSIQLAVRRAAWLRVTADGRVTAERIFKQGETQQIGATREISVRAGDGGAVTVAVDGRQPVALGREGEVITRRFAVETTRVQPPAPPKPAAPSPSVLVARAAPERATAPANTAVLSTPPPTVSNPKPAEPPPSSLSTSPVATAAPLAAAPARPPVGSTDRSAVSSVAPAATSQPSLQESLTNQVSRWHDAYYRQDRAMLSAIAPQANVADDRGAKERLPGGLNGVRRSLEDVNFKIYGSEAMLTAKMTERMDNGAAGQMAQAVSFISHMWTQQNGAWQLHDVRIISASALSRSVGGR